MNNETNLHEAMIRLSDLGMLEGTEVGESWLALCSLWSYHQSVLSKEFVKHLEKEIISAAKETADWKIGTRKLDVTEQYLIRE